VLEEQDAADVPHEQGEDVAEEDVAEVVDAFTTFKSVMPKEQLV